MKDLMMNEDFSDVTLVTEDKKQIKANFNILSASSPVFKDILNLKKEKSSTLVYLRGIQYSEMESIMQFIYLGQATFYEERKNEFLAVARLLEIKDLCNSECETKDEQSDSEMLTEKFKEEIILSGDIAKQTAPEKEECAVMSFECDLCHKTYSRSQALYHHKQSVHQGIKYACNQCDYKTATQSNLTIHIKSKHEGIRYTGFTTNRAVELHSLRRIPPCFNSQMSRMSLCPQLACADVT